MAAMHGAPTEFQEALAREPSPRPNSPAATVFRTKAMLHIPDIRAHERFSTQRVATLGGARTLLIVPMLRAKEVIGAIAIYRQEVRPFSDNQIELIKNFAAQAVIAIENTRLLNELRQRTEDLSEALEQQTATSEVLKTISSSPGNLEPVFNAMLANATRICEAKFGVLLLFDGETFRFAAEVGTPPAFAELVRQRGPFRPLAGGHLDRVMQTKQLSHTADYAAESILSPPVKLGGARSMVDVPMLKDGELVGVFSIYRQEVRPFTDKQIALVQNFAAQAVIAIENARLLNELRQSLEQQTGTANVLGVISSTPGELQPVYDAMLQNAVRLCDAKFGNIYRWDGDAFTLVATHNTPPALIEARRSAPFRPHPDTGMGRIVATKTPAHIADLAAEQTYSERKPAVIEAVELGGIRTLLAVPVLKEDVLVGAITIFRQEVRPFTEKQIALVQNFAAQAVIAIENTRLLNELKQSLEQQTATADVLRIISTSPSDLGPVFQAILENATRICDAKFGVLHLAEGDHFRRTAYYNTPPAYLELQSREPVYRPGQGTAFARVATTKQFVHITDIAAEHIVHNLPLEVLGIRTLVVVPMLKGTELIGGIAIFRQEVRAFTDKQIELVQNFANQAVIAIENTRLLNELRERTEEVVKLNQQLEQRVADQVGEIERMGRLRRFLPPQVADLIIASGTEKQLESHRREITALFCDLRGFTGFSESSDPEDVMALLRDYHAAIGEIIIKYSGTLERYAGDGVMVVFNDPVPVENPALQAVLMALEMRDAIGTLTETWHRWGHDIGFGIGIAHGFATLGTIGFEGRFDYAAIGTVSNVASRLCDEAKPGQILISPRVLTKVENVVTVEPVGEFTLKGIRRPMVAYNVLASASSKPN
jgi:GAF domain-containing protein